MERICKVIEDALGNEVERDIGRNMDSKKGTSSRINGRDSVTEGTQLKCNEFAKARFHIVHLQ